MEVPWFALSPSPFSIIFYLLLIFLGMRKLIPKVKYKRFKHLILFTDCIFIVGLIVLILDSVWIMICLARFGLYYPNSVLQLIFSLGRNLLGIILCYYLIGSFFQRRICSINKKTQFLFYLNAFFMFVWFYLAPSPAWTDWTFAIRYDYPFEVIVSSFLISHLLGKSLVALTYLSIWK